MRKYYYALEWIYGPATNENGERIASYHRFLSKKQRDEWVANGADFVGPGQRDALKSSDSELRKILRNNRNYWE